MADKKRTELDWEDVRVFLALARYGSLSAAARVLSVNHATVARRVRSLERSLGERLVERRIDGYVLTPAGTRLLGPAKEMETAAANLSRGGGDDRPVGLVRVNAPPSLSQHFLASRLAGLCGKYPGIDINLATDFRAVSLERHEADIALRFGRPRDGDVLAKRLRSIEFGFYANAEYRRRLNAGADPTFVGFDEANAHLPEALWLAEHFAHRRISFRTNSQSSQSAAARAGAGIALLPHFIGKMDDRLVICELDLEPPTRELWLIIRRQDRESLHIKTVAEHIASIFAKEPGFFDKKR
ncbi:LysR family transcriptional regulator [Bradyrhizobium sp.]|uniref:LysR family transcriptional regulator n=1 Tax=Bradyrhizobium sp. TaxID=376 RepID=UPI00262D6F5E|nr:LysR family transcriptional regulator [Bradyrhizobium sp.]